MRKYLVAARRAVEAIDDVALSSLYRGCDAFVLAYRGEGFGMPLLEAMACGKTVITTAEGPAKDFCNESSAYLVPANEEIVTDTPPHLCSSVSDTILPVSHPSPRRRRLAIAPAILVLYA